MLSVFLIAGTLFANDRVALVIGCNDYQHAPKLKNATADARAVSGLLSRADFDVIEILDPGVEAIYEGLEEFSKRSKSKEIGIVYFAGHGVEIESRNYLLPTDAELNSESQLRTQTIQVGTVLEDLERTGFAAKMLILDSCRNDPLSRSWIKTRSGGPGLGELEDTQIPPSTMVMFAAAPGQVASDGAGAHSPFTEALLQNLTKPGVSAFDAFLTVSDTVSAATEEKQVPWVKFDGAARAFRSMYFSGDPPPTTSEQDSMNVRAIVPGVQLGPYHLGMAPIEVSRIAGNPEKAKSYSDGDSIVYHYYSKGMKFRFLFGALEEIFLYSGNLAEPTKRHPIPFEACELPLDPYEGKVTLRSTYEETLAALGEPRSGVVPNKERDGGGTLFYDGFHFFYDPEGHCSYFSVTLSPAGRMRVWNDHIQNSPERAEQSEKLKNLFHVGGLRPGSYFAEAREKWGEPQAMSDSGNAYYFGDTRNDSCMLLLAAPRSPGYGPFRENLILRFHVNSKKAAEGVAKLSPDSAEWFLLFGQERQEILERLGTPASEGGGYLEYQFSDGKHVGEIYFLCPSFYDYKCSEIEIVWHEWTF